jgi:hypothetical protein
MSNRIKNNETQENNFFKKENITKIVYVTMITLIFVMSIFVCIGYYKFNDKKLIYISGNASYTSLLTESEYPNINVVKIELITSYTISIENDTSNTNYTYSVGYEIFTSQIQNEIEVNSISWSILMFQLNTKLFIPTSFDEFTLYIYDDNSNTYSVDLTDTYKMSCITLNGVFQTNSSISYTLESINPILEFFKYL